jgi:rifampicin phosphotransferase
MQVKTETQAITPFFIAEPKDGNTLGGKASNLFELKKLGLNVPQFVVIPSEALYNLLPIDLVMEADVQSIRNFISSLEVDGEFIQNMLSAFSGANYFSVRSSAVDEDGADFSFAGQYDSFLFVTAEKIGEKIKSVWLSAFNERALSYRVENNLPINYSIAVIVQQMLDPEVSGVGFGANVTNGNRKEKIISAVFGVGEGLVSGELNADNFYVQDQLIRKQLAVKEKKMVLNAKTGGTILAEVPQKQQALPTLNDAQVLQLSSVLDQLKSHFGKPQDIEFAFVNEELFLLQSRPLTSLHNLPDLSGEYIVWDNSNIVESYPGITSPLTFSFILPVYEGVYRQFVAMMGVKENEIEENREVFANMLGLLDGRVYYNLLSWYKALALLPGYSLNAEFMEKMMGVKERFELKDRTQKSRFSEKLRVLRMARLMLRNLRQLPRMRKDFVRDFNATMKEFSEINFGRCNNNELLNYYSRFEQTLLKKWRAPLVNDFFAMIFYGVLQKLIVKYNLPQAGTLHNDLLCGAKDIISTQPAKRCIAIAVEIQKSPALKKLFLSRSPNEIVAELQEPSNKNLNNQIDQYIADFGDRCVAELKLETITYSQKPENFIAILKSYVEQGISENSFSSETESGIRKNAEELLERSLSGKFIRKAIFSYFLRRSRELVSARENLRYERTRAFGMIRKIFCAIGQNLFADSLINEPRDIFFLTKEEIFHFVRGTSVHTDLKALIQLRKGQYSKFSELQPSERIKTYGTVYQSNNFYPAAENIKLDGDLQGIPCCAGRVKGKVRVITDPGELKNLNGDILVTSSTDPGWITLFPTASAILVERGSLLSHSAIVSREMGKPCIVGVTGLLLVLKTGDEIEMDGSTGEIKIIRPA